MLDKLDRLDVTVGTVEQFQGEEREVIISTAIYTMTLTKLVVLDFLVRNPRKFNVGITLARSVLFIVGNPHIICKVS